MSNRSAPSICAESVRNRWRVLLKALRNPSEASAKIFDGCESQSSLASMSMPEEGIAPLSRNSLYKYANLELADERIPNGFKDEGCTGHRCLDWLRNEVKKIRKSERFARTKLARTNRFEQRLEEHVKQIDELRKNSLAVSKAYLHLFTSLRGLSADESASAVTRQRIANLLNDHDRLYSELFQEVGALRPANLEVL